MQDLYTTKQASTATGVSGQAIRTYTARYERYFSAEATPGPGRDRRYTSEDVRLIAFIAAQTRTGANHDDVQDQLANGALDSFVWEPAAHRDATETPDSTEAHLVPLERLQAAHALLQDAQRREDEAKAQTEALQAEIQRLTLELGQAQGKLAATYRAPRWWRALFGGGE